jgi:hypothetical protein
MGWLADKPGSFILQDKIDEIQQNRFSLLIFALATQADEHIITELQRNWNEIHFLTGERILFVAFYDARPNQYKFYARRSQYQHSTQFDPNVETLLGMPSDRIDGNNFMETMTRESYELARRLSIPETDLPCLVFVETHNASIYQVLNLNNVVNGEFVYILREFVYRYHSANREYFDTLQRIEELERNLTNQIANLRRIPEDIEAAKTRMQQLRRGLDVERERLRQNISRQLQDNFQSPQKTRLLEVRVILDSLNRLSEASESDARNMLFKWVREGEWILIGNIVLEQHLPQLLQYLTELGSGDMKRESIELTARLERGNPEPQQRSELLTRLTALKAAKEAVRARFLLFANQQLLFDRDKSQEYFQSLEAEEQTLSLIVDNQISDIYVTHLERQVDNELAMMRDSVEREIAILEESEEDRRTNIKNQMDVLTEQIYELKSSIQNSHPDAFGVLDELRLKNRIRQVKLSAGAAFREHASTIADFLSRIFAG